MTPSHDQLMYCINKTIITSFLTLLLFGFSTTAQCQQQNKFTKQGTVELGGSFSFEFYGPSAISYSIAPYIGWFPIEGLELGIYPSDSYADQGIDKSNTVMLLFAPSYNYKISERSFIFVEGLIGYAHVYGHGIESGPSEKPSSPYTVSDSGIAYGGHIGVKVAISDHVLFNIGAQYLRTVYPALQDLTFGYNDISLVAGFTVVL